MRFILLTTFLLFWSNQFHAQVESVTLSTDKCAHVYSGLDINYNDPTFDVSTDYNRGVTHYSRGFIEFDLSSIPSDAIIISATLTITNSGGTYTTNPWVTKLVTSSWIESGFGSVKISAQPTISSLSSDWETSYTNSGNDVNIDVKSTVQRMVYGAVDNYGWCMQVQNESVAYDSGTSFHSDEASSDQPELAIVYYKPVTFSNVDITHESGTGQSDGSISFSHTDMDTTGHEYTWYNSIGLQIQQPGTNSTITDLSYGWYGVKIEGITNGETYYYGFLVGTECEEVTITYTDLADFVENNRVLSDNPNNAYPDGAVLRAEAWTNGGWFYSRSYLRYYTWMDEEFIINQADLEMDNFPPSWARHYSSTSPTNAAKFNIINDNWNKDFVTYNLSPTSSSSTHAELTATATGYSTVSKTIDMTDLWEQWQLDNNANYGCAFELDTYSQVFNKQLYASNLYATSSYHPVWTFKLRLDAGYECGDYSFFLKDEVEQSIAYVPGTTLKFKFLEDYHDATGNLSYSLKLLEGDNVQFGTISKNHLTNWFELTDGIGGVSLTSGKVYLLEVENSKGQKAYLKFKMS